MMSGQALNVAGVPKSLAEPQPAAVPPQPKMAVSSQTLPKSSSNGGKTSFADKLKHIPIGGWVSIIVVIVAVAAAVTLGVILGNKHKKTKEPTTPQTQTFLTSSSSPRQVYRLGNGSYVYGQMCQLYDSETGAPVPVIVLPKNVGNNQNNPDQKIPEQLARGVKLTLQKGYYHVLFNVAYKFTRTDTNVGFVVGTLVLFLGTIRELARNDRVIGDGSINVDDLSLNQSKTISFKLEWQGHLDGSQPLYFTSAGSTHEIEVVTGDDKPNKVPVIKVGNPRPFDCGTNPPKNCAFPKLEWAAKTSPKNTNITITKLD